MCIGEDTMVNSAQGLTDENVKTAIAWEQNATITSSETAANEIIPFPGRKQLLPRQPGRQWQPRIISSIKEILDLQENWNSYGAPCVRYDTAMFGILILENIMNAGTPLPSVVPTTRGGIQFEWHENDIDLEIEVLEPYRCEYVYEDARNGAAPVSGEITDEFDALQEPIATLTQRAQDEIFALRQA